jgi:hypothetical protein
MENFPPVKISVQRSEFNVQACSERSEESFLDIVRSFEAQDARGAHLEL